MLLRSVILVFADEIRKLGLVVPRQFVEEKLDGR